MVKTTVKEVKFIDIPKVHDKRGSLSVIENGDLLFNIERVYYLYDVPSDAYRGGHAHKKLYQLLIPLSGSFDVRVDDGENKKTITLNKPQKGLLIVPGIWREIDNFSSGAVCLVLASTKFDEGDYIRNYNDFLLFKKP